MTEDDLTTEVLEKVLGWKRTHVQAFHHGWYSTVEHKVWCYPDGTLVRFLYDSPPDLPDLARLVEDEIERRGLGARYAQRLLALVIGTEIDVTRYDEGGHVTPGVLWLLVRATPAQRCRAALEVVNQ